VGDGAVTYGANAFKNAVCIVSLMFADVVDVLIDRRIVPFDVGSSMKERRSC
jgi:hypothetical protein